jgi:hypothetical protein
MRFKSASIGRNWLDHKSFVGKELLSPRQIMVNKNKNVMGDTPYIQLNTGQWITEKGFMRMSAVWECNGRSLEQFMHHYGIENK